MRCQNCQVDFPFDFLDFCSLECERDWQAGYADYLLERHHENDDEERRIGGEE